MPTSVTLGQVLAAAPGALDDAIGLAAHWTRADRDGHPIARLGVGADGVVEIDLVRDGPHALVAGTTGSGKSELLRTMVASIAADAGPDDVTFVLIDYKGGATFDACADLPHTVGVVTDLDERLAARAIRQPRCRDPPARAGCSATPAPSTSPTTGGHLAATAGRRCLVWSS